MGTPEDGLTQGSEAHAKQSSENSSSEEDSTIAKSDELDNEPGNDIIDIPILTRQVSPVIKHDSSPTKDRNPDSSIPSPD